MPYAAYDTRLAAYAVIIDTLDTGSGPREHVLLALWNEPDEPLWTLPGGGVDLHESAEEGAIREVREESGYDVELEGLLGVDTLATAPEDRIVASERWQKNVRVVFRARVVGGELTHEVDGTTDEARWIPLADLGDLPRIGLVRKFVG